MKTGGILRAERTEGDKNLLPCPWVQKDFLTGHKNPFFQMPDETMVAVQSRAPFRVRGRAKAPVVAYKMRPAFLFELYYHALRSKCAERTGQLQIMNQLITQLQSQIGEDPAPFDKCLI
jgi:hypothetical protein